jgi:hypothetical protein
MWRSPLIAAFALAACSQPNSASAAKDAPPPQVREEITAACAGGITGGGGGVTIRPDDHVIRWSRAGASGVRTERDLGADPVFATEVRRQLDAIHFSAMESHDTGNMTCSLSLGSHEVSWSLGDPHAPNEVVAVHDLVSTADGAE